MAASHADVAKAMGSVPLMRDVPAAALEAFAAQGTIRHYRRGTYLFHQGDPAPDISFLLDGRVEITTTSATGHRQLHTTMEEPEFFGELGPLAGGFRTATAEAVDDSVVWTVDADRFVDHVISQPAAARALLTVLAKQVLAHEVIVEDLLFLDLKGRVAKRLLGLVSPSLDELPADGTALPSIVTHADLASLAGGSRENVSRILSEFQKRGLVARDGRRLVLTDVARLKRIAGV